MPPFLLPLLPTPMDGSPSKDDDGRMGHVGKAQITGPVTDQAVVAMAGDRPVNQSDAAAIQVCFCFFCCVSREID